MEFSRPTVHDGTFYAGSSRPLVEETYEMPQSLAQIWLHLVFSTKKRRPWLKDPSFRDELDYAAARLKFAENLLRKG